MFYIPMLNYFYSGHSETPAPHVERVIEHVRNVAPFWNRTGGWVSYQEHRG